MSDQWSLGDLAECICDDWERHDLSPAEFVVPQKGCIYFVTKIEVRQFRGENRTMLFFPEWRLDNFCASGFKKVQPKGEDMLVPRREAVPA